MRSQMGICQKKKKEKKNDQFSEHFFSQRDARSFHLPGPQGRDKLGISHGNGKNPGGHGRVVGHPVRGAGATRAREVTPQRCACHIASFRSKCQKQSPCPDIVEHRIVSPMAGHRPRLTRETKKKKKTKGSRSKRAPLPLRMYAGKYKNEGTDAQAGASAATDEARRAATRCALTLKCLSDSLLHVPL